MAAETKRTTGPGIAERRCGRAADLCLTVSEILPATWYGLPEAIGPNGSPPLKRIAADIMALFDTLHAEGQTVIIVTHEPDIAAHCRRSVRLHDGRVQSDVTNPERSLV